MTLYELQMVTSRIAAKFGIDRTIWRAFTAKIQALQEHNATHYAHSLRVGIYCTALAVLEKQQDLHYPLFAGCGHDIGKCNISNDVLDAQNFGEAEFEAIKAHPQQGFQYLIDDFPYTAFVAGLHHAFQPHPYGLDPVVFDQDAPFHLTEEARTKILNMVHLVEVCDFYDAITTRNGPHKNDPWAAMFERFPDQTDRLLLLAEM